MYAIAFLGSTPIGSPIIGWVAQHHGARSALMVGAVATLAAALYGWIALLRTKLRQNAAPERGAVTQVRAA